MGWRGMGQPPGEEVAGYNHQGFAGCKPWTISPRACDRNIGLLLTTWHGDPTGYLGEVSSSSSQARYIHIPCLLMVSP